MDLLGCWREVVNIGAGGLHRIDETSVLADPENDFHPVVLWLPF